MVREFCVLLDRNPRKDLGRLRLWQDDPNLGIADMFLSRQGPINRSSTRLARRDETIAVGRSLLLRGLPEATWIHVCDSLVHVVPPLGVCSRIGGVVQLAIDDVRRRAHIEKGEGGPRNENKETTTTTEMEFTYLAGEYGPPTPPRPPPLPRPLPNGLNPFAAGPGCR